jgi:CarD family transcriptional regulator
MLPRRNQKVMNSSSSTVLKSKTAVRAPARSAKSQMSLPFKKGEKVVYPAHGVAVIDDIQMRVISGTERRFYMLRILGTEKMTIMIPTENVEQVGLRRVIGKDMVDKIYRILRQRKVEVDTQTWNRRYREYTEKIKTGSPLEIAKVLRDLLVLKSDKELSFGERKMLDTARSLLVKELSIAKAHPEEQIMEELRTIFAN